MAACLLGESCTWKTPARDLLDVNHSLLSNAQFSGRSNTLVPERPL